MKCSTCESEDVVKNGFNYGSNGMVQKYRCMSCRKIFSYTDRLPENHVTSEIVSLVIDLYIKGLSYRVTQQQIKEQFEIKLSHVAIYQILQKYSLIIKKYTDSLAPKLSAVWQMDETVIDFKSKPENKHLEGIGGNWCWIAIDTGTRYIVDMFLSVSKDNECGLRFFERLKKVSKEDPKVITTDGNRAYFKGLKKYFPQAVHLRIKKISVKPNTSFIERYNGTVKNRTKTMRGFDAFRPCQNTLALFQAYYNFLRPHMALDGRTPAQAAGIDLELPHRWISLIRRAMLS